MSEVRYKIVFDGALLPGVEATTAKLNLAELFKTDVAAIERLFSGRPVALKRDLSQADAQTYLQALTKTGIAARIENEPRVELNLSDVHEHTPAHPALSTDPESPYAPRGRLSARRCRNSPRSRRSVSKAVSAACAIWPGRWS